MKPQEGEGRIPGYWEESRAGTGMALTTAETNGQDGQVGEAGGNGTQPDRDVLVT